MRCENFLLSLSFELSVFLLLLSIKLFFLFPKHSQQKGIDDEDIKLLNAFPPAYETLAREHRM
jgi:hypothetical protein